jgi:hypothetical protein
MKFNILVTKSAMFLGLMITLISIGSATGAQQTSATSPSNHPYEGIYIAYAKSQLTPCSFAYSPINFCDDRHLGEIRSAIANQRPGFNKHFILLTPIESAKYHQRSVMAIDAIKGTVYPLPIDAYSGPMGKLPAAKADGKVTYSLDGNEVCIDGTILAYRTFNEGHFCFQFENDRFVGYHTPYMYTDQ